MKWEAPMEELPTLPLTTPQGCLPSFQLYECQELTHWYTSDHRDKGLGCVLWFLEWGQVEHANLMIPAFRCWRAIWLTTVTPKAGFQPPLLRFLFQSGTFLLFRLDEHRFIHVMVHEAHLDCFDWRLMERRDLEIRNNEVSQTLSDKIIVIFAQEV